MRCAQRVASCQRLGEAWLRSGVLWGCSWQLPRPAAALAPHPFESCQAGRRARHARPARHLHARRLAHTPPPHTPRVRRTPAWWRTSPTTAGRCMPWRTRVGGRPGQRGPLGICFLFSVIHGGLLAAGAPSRLQGRAAAAHLLAPWPPPACAPAEACWAAQRRQRCCEGPSRAVLHESLSGLTSQTARHHTHACRLPALRPIQPCP